MTCGGPLLPPWRCSPANRCPSPLLGPGEQRRFFSVPELQARSSAAGLKKRAEANARLSRPHLLNHYLPQLPSRLPSTHTPWSGRGSWRPGGARHCTNDLDARGRVCSALPGSTADGMEAPAPATHGRHSRTGPPAISEPERPRRRLVRSVAALHGDRLMATGPIHVWARVGVGGAERAEGRSAGAARAGKRARRSGAQPGLDEVEKPVTARLDDSASIGQFAQRPRYAGF